MRVAGLTAFGGVNRAPQLDDLCFLQWQGTTLVGCCDLQNSWDEVTRKSHYPVSFPAAQQIPGFLQHSPRYKVETGKINTQKETSRMAAGAQALSCIKQDHGTLCIGRSSLRRGGMLGVQWCGKKYWKYWQLPLASRNRWRWNSFFLTRFIFLGSVLHASLNRSEFSHRSRETQKALFLVSYHIPSSCQAVSYLHTCAQPYSRRGGGHTAVA